ncbi:TonB-dependent receptor [Dechloromonas denitrificans]|uniref:TonB-dependent receptor n=1 Tax=Dechloromonas denitrificans TaxID=281362 RepID=UPI001CF89310|nr:TonB-dependent siderophore receptor [Dechloromonas denitrificans]UCV02629.1 TonB-dependent siderophore receptor [Dechloromonas denitrificans]
MAHIRSRKHSHASHLLALVAAALPAAGNAQESETSLPAMTVKAAADVPYKADNAASTKFTAPLLDTPKTVTVITQEVLKQTNAASLQEALRTTPGITFGMGEGGTPEGDSPVIRGFSAQANTFIDGLRDPSSQSRNMFAIEQIDISKGADSAFSGGGAVGGSINLTTKNARLGSFNEASIGLGTDKYVRATADLNQQLTDNAAVRINLLKETGDVAGRNEVDYDHLGVNISAALGLGGPTRATVGFYHYETDDMPDYGHPYNNPYAATNPRSVFNGDGGPLKVDRDNFYGLTSRDFRKTEVDSGTLKIEHDINSKWTIRNATRFTKSLNDYVVTNPGDSNGLNISNTSTGTDGLAGTAIRPGYLNRSSKNRHSTTEAFVNATELTGEFFTGSVKHNIATGFELSRTETDNRGYLVTGANIAGLQVAGAPLASISNPDPNAAWNGNISRTSVGAKIDTTSRGIYLFDTATLSKQWLLNLGLRYDHFSSRSDGYSTTGYTAGSTTTVYVPVNLRSDSGFASYQAGLIYKPLENGSIYLNYATAANPSGVSASDGTDNLAVTNQDLEPEKVRNIELGTKWNLLGNKLSLTAAVFKLDKTNAKVAIDANTWATVGKQETEGYELGFAGALTDKWQVFGGYTHLKSELVEVGPLAANQVNKGKQFPNTPEDSFSLWSSYKVLPKLTLGGGAYYVSKVYGNTANTKWVPEYWRYDAMASYEVARNFSLRLNIQNLTDKTYYDRAYTTHMVSVAPGRQAIMTANFKF